MWLTWQLSQALFGLARDRAGNARASSSFLSTVLPRHLSRDFYYEPFSLPYRHVDDDGCAFSIALDTYEFFAAALYRYAQTCIKNIHAPTLSDDRATTEMENRRFHREAASKSRGDQIEP